MMDMRIKNADYNNWPANGLEEPAPLRLKNINTDEWPVVTDQKVARWHIEACLQAKMTLVTFDVSDRGKMGEISPDCMNQKLEAALQSEHSSIIIDFSGTTSLEETSENDAAGFLLKALSRASQSHKKFILCGMNATIEERLQRLRVTSLYTRCISVKEAMCLCTPAIAPPPTPSDRP